MRASSAASRSGERARMKGVALYEATPQVKLARKARAPLSRSVFGDEKMRSARPMVASASSCSALSMTSRSARSMRSESARTASRGGSPRASSVDRLDLDRLAEVEERGAAKGRLRGVVETGGHDLDVERFAA